MIVHDEGGASILEFALTAPLLIFLAIGTFQVGTFMYDGIEVSNAARAAVQYATNGSGSDPSPLYKDTPGIIAAAVADANDLTLTKPTTSDVSIFYACSGTTTVESATSPTSCSPASDHVNAYVRVVAQGTFASLITVPGIPSSLTITRTAVGEISP